MITKFEAADSRAIKSLIVCADDFGMNAAANRAILELADHGRLTATSCLVDGPFFAEGSSLLRGAPLQKGLHLNFTDDLGQPGLHQPINTLIFNAYFRRLDRGQIRAQIVRQLDRYEGVMGAPPDYVDGHLHVHQLPQIRDELIEELAIRYSGKAGFWLRSTVVRSQPSMPRGQRFKAFIIQQLGAKSLSRLARQHGFGTNAGFMGVYDFRGGSGTYAKYLVSWLQVAVSGDVLMCHPEHYHPEDTRIDPQRNAEFDVLMGDMFDRQLRRHGLVLRV